MFPEGFPFHQFRLQRISRGGIPVGLGNVGRFYSCTALLSNVKNDLVGDFALCFWNVADKYTVSPAVLVGFVKFLLEEVHLE